jgi:hypothetical protein
MQKIIAILRFFILKALFSYIPIFAKSIERDKLI